MELKLDRLEVLTGLTEFAEKQRAKGSPYVNGWAGGVQMSAWYKKIAELRAGLPEEVVREFDDARQRKQHRPNCECLICTDP